ncbi:glucose dehydrogenase [FAD, quinone]-like isoform X2 [Leptopilina heterotoma]|nr:glucose dehydrogenase [FAD, quinone]-like isoform X2 [Leptopilina heterotoma]XP_043478007.1 glucose dehydrogenase [FAD, quinone]-like isoform X2 [Leptopilina heterotoma]
MNCSYCPLPVTSHVTLASSCGGSAFLLFMGLLETYIQRQCDLEDPCHRIRPHETPNSSYDFIVIGAGSAGSVVASRLSEQKDFSVLLLEAGLDEPAWSQVPSFYLNTLRTELDWQYNYEGEECLKDNKLSCSWPRGKVLGGTSSINGMIYIRGSRKDFNNWEKLGNKGWAYKDVLTYFKKSENNQQIDKMDTGFHSQRGPLSVTQLNYHPPMCYDILKAGKELGYNTVDVNGKVHTGFAIIQSTTDRGSRFSSARAFLRPARNRQNLHIMLNSTATRIIFNHNKRAIGVEFYKNGKFMKIRVNKEIIISGGIVNSPQLLMNSGVGAKEELASVRIPLVHDLPGVGKNLHDHVLFPLDFTINETEFNNLTWVSALDYLLFRKGPLSGIGISTITGLVHSKYSNPQDDHPDLQIFFSGYMPRCSESGEITGNSSVRKQIRFVSTVIHPKSKGFLRLRNSDPRSKPLIYPKYMTHLEDINVMIEGIKFMLRLAGTRALRKYDFQLDRTPVKNCEQLEFGSDSYWTCAIKHKRSPGYHQAGSCKMGPHSDPMAVVDNHLKVRGIRGVRVADASIMPEVTSGNTNAPSIMIGERAADFIKFSWRSFKYQ